MKDPRPSISPGLPSWWLDEALAAERDAPEAPPLEGDAQADVAIVGGGPSGRNGGFLNGYWTHLSGARSVFGDEGALELGRIGSRILPAVKAFLAAREEDVWLRDGGYLKVSVTEAQDAAIEKSVETARELGVPEEARPLTAEEVAGHVRSPVFRRGVMFRDGSTIQPARLARALRRAVLADGIALHERTRVTAIRTGRPTVLETPRGRLTADEVVVATNAAMTGWRPLRSRLTNFGSYIVLTEPVPELLEEIGWTGGEAITDGRMFIHYFRTTADGRVAMGSGSGPIGHGGRLDDGRFTSDAPTAGRAEEGLRRLLPALAGVKVERAWGGPIDVSADHFPFFGTLPRERVHYGVGYSGHGVGPSWLAGQTLASLALGRDDEWSASPLVRTPRAWLPPEPLKRAGGGAIRAAILAVEEAEEAGRRPPLLGRAVGTLPRLLRMPLGTR